MKKPISDTPEELQEAIAKELGWTQLTLCHERLNGIYPGDKKKNPFSIVPDWPFSLDRAAELEDLLSDMELSWYDTSLRRFVAIDNSKEGAKPRSIARTTAVQRCKAWLTVRMASKEFQR